MPFCVPLVQLPDVDQLRQLLAPQPVDLPGDRGRWVAQLQLPEPRQFPGPDRVPVLMHPGQERKGDR